MRKLLGLAAALALPTLLAAQTPQIPNDAASQTAKDKVTLHRQNPQRGPADEASQTAKDKVAEHRATQRRGEVVGLDNRPTWIAKPPAQRAQPGVSPAMPPAARPPQPAMPAQPPAKPLDPGQSGNHRP